jgi:AcrR family transcriptional regulator
VASERRAIDDAGLLRLLWRGEETPSTRSGLTVSRIVEAGIELADADGLESLSMRRVADHLGVGTMSLYTYVPGKRELVWLMLDQVYGELPDHLGDDPHWRARLTTMADQYWELYHRHPWLLDVPIGRPAAGPNVMDRYELDLSSVDGLGLDELEMDAVVELIQSNVAAAADRLRGIRQDVEASGMSDDEWWYAVLPTLTQLLADRDYPLSSRVGQAVGAPHLDTSYLRDFGLARILDGLETLIAARGGTTEAD